MGNRLYGGNRNGYHRKALTFWRKLTVRGWEGGKHRSAAIRDFAQGVDERGRKGAKLGKRINRSWVGRGSAKLGGNT